MRIDSITFDQCESAERVQRAAAELLAAIDACPGPPCATSFLVPRGPNRAAIIGILVSETTAAPDVIRECVRIMTKNVDPTIEQVHVLVTAFGEAMAEGIHAALVANGKIPPCDGA